LVAAGLIICLVPLAPHISALALVALVTVVLIAAALWETGAPASLRFR
jgi:hypothetical protein